MPELPESLGVRWLFPDNIMENYEYKFLDFIPKYTTTNNKNIPVFLLWGKTVDEKQEVIYEGELLTTIWNVYNYRELRENLGTNTDKWDKNLFFKIKKERDKLVLLPVELVK